MSSTDKYLNVVEDVDPLESLTGKLVRLVKVDGSRLYFRTKTGLLIMNDLRKITELREYVPKQGAV